MKFSGLAYLDMKNICGKFRCKQTSTQKVIALVFDRIVTILKFALIKISLNHQ